MLGRLLALPISLESLLLEGRPCQGKIYLALLDSQHRFSERIQGLEAENKELRRENQALWRALDNLTARVENLQIPKEEPFAPAREEENFSPAEE